MPRVPPITRTAPSLDIVVLLELLPRRQPAVGVARRRLRRLRLDPADLLRAVVVEAVDAADRREHHVAGVDLVDGPVELRLDVAGEEEVSLLERVVVLLGRAARLV